MAGKATVRAPSSSATFRLSLWHPASRADRSSLLAYTGPTVWMTHRAGRFPAVVATARPAGRPSGNRSARRRLLSSRMAGPPRRWMAPSTPLPPISEEFAAFTTASTSCSVMSPWINVMRGTTAILVAVELAEPVVGDAEEVGDLVDHRVPDDGLQPVRISPGR